MYMYTCYTLCICVYDNLISNGHGFVCHNEVFVWAVCMTPPTKCCMLQSHNHAFLCQLFEWLLPPKKEQLYHVCTNAHVETYKASLYYCTIHQATIHTSYSMSRYTWSTDSHTNSWNVMHVQYCSYLVSTGCYCPLLQQHIHYTNTHPTTHTYI